jgi:hypothetical protein
MYLIEDILVSDSVLSETFHCNLNACKGACCVEGDSGAPLETEELHILEKDFPNIKPFLTSKGIEAIESQGIYALDESDQTYVTPLIDGGPCAYINYDKHGIALCGIENAYMAGKTTFKKPISCHLYPIRISKNKKTEFEAINYEKWDICNPACSLGNELKMPVFRFVKDALIRKYGTEFYLALEDAYQSNLK